MKTINSLFITITDSNFFPGTIATVNSILHFHPHAEISIVFNEKQPLFPKQRNMLKSCPNIRLLSSSEFEGNGRYINAWELKAYAACDLCDGYDVIVGIDSDCILCAGVDDIIDRCYENGGFLGGKDGEAEGDTYDAPYAIYGMDTPQHYDKYMSTSLYFCAVTNANRATLKRWAKCSSQADYNSQGPYPGHGDQGILNALLFAEDKQDRIELLDNALWSQHRLNWSSIIGFDHGKFINISAGRHQQRSFHSVDYEKYWRAEHREIVLESNSLQTYPYVWFLTLFWFGQCRAWNVDPFEYLDEQGRHLVDDLLLFLPQIFQVYPPAKLLWDDLGDAMILRMTSGIFRYLTLEGGVLSELISLIGDNPQVRRYVEIGAYHGGSLLPLAIRFANKDISFTAVESFMGNFDGTTDGWALPSRNECMANFARFPSQNARLVAGESSLAVELFADSSIDMLFIDGCQDTAAMLKDIDLWLPKITEHGIIAGDDYNWDSVRDAVDASFQTVQAARSEKLWWTLAHKNTRHLSETSHSKSLGFRMESAQPNRYTSANAAVKA